MAILALESPPVKHRFAEGDQREEDPLKYAPEFDSSTLSASIMGKIHQGCTGPFLLRAAGLQYEFF
jgi:hypothetical protein